jgi:hypothetical protein
MRTKLEEIKQKLRRRMHQSIHDQGRRLAHFIRGYFCLSGRADQFSGTLRAFPYHPRRLWLRTLQRRSQKDSFSWEGITKLANDND